MEIIRNPKVFDVCIVGSGAAGGMTAYALTREGADVLMLEAGPWWDSATDSAMFTWPYESPRRGAAIPERQFGEFDAGLGGWTLEGEPYTVAEGTQFDWYRARMLGGRTNHWGRISLRFGPYDFRRRSIDGLGDDWPISYEDVKPYYDRVDELVGIFGSAEGLPNEPDGVFLPPPKPRCYEVMVKNACDRLNVTCIPSRLSILTRSHHGRAACHYCGQCGRGCSTHSNFSSPSVLLPPALQTGKLEIITNAMAREVSTNNDGLATGVYYVNKEDGTEHHVRARIVVLAASAMESVRILFNSKSSRFPEGLANSSGVLGKYITDSTGAHVSGFIPRMMEMPPHNEDGVGGMHLYMPWWLDNSKLDFPRGYHIEFGGGKRNTPGDGFMGGIQNYNGDRPRGGGGYGKQLKDDYRRYYGAFIGFSGRGEMVAREDSYIEIDPHVVDRFGIPVLRFHMTWTDWEYKQARHMQETFRKIIHTLGGTPLQPMPSKEEGYGLATPGRIIHEIGGARMGKDPKTSVTNGYGQAHDVKNLFVTDGATFVSQADKNPTWTILALSWRTGEYIADQRRKGAL